MDVVLHYKDHNGILCNLVSRAEGALEHFPRRAIPAFTPWFPSGYDKSLPLKPQRDPPVISVEDLKEVKGCLQQSEPLVASRIPEAAKDLKDFPPTHLEGLLVRPWLSAEHINSIHGQKTPSSGKAKPRRSWSVFCHGSAFNKNIQPFSKQFQEVVERCHLHLLQRAKWIIRELNCVTSSLEHVWTMLIRSMRQSKLPTCNVNIQRDLGQIWVFCDVLYSECVGQFLIRQCQLAGQISLSVHKQGEVFSM
ncbi:shieldin complex subunit 3 [Brienomyrus brachyistius]|uniref:shieldin complex subunit 3 n=1 Tax=Brienomyrus brachyistius TaxID=42636 RepID=UPI0020B39B96|nr:shieldin complex subunit 3 [Brienomyrus brachyistius]